MGPINTRVTNKLYIKFVDCFELKVQNQRFNYMGNKLSESNPFGVIVLYEMGVEKK